ncbi:MAG: hypothetical protein QFX34_01490 [Candidatus Verstraetearchaeota archaeon]|nr:hypothetical protein [Candidatus Verstraetearchaeota archaeon]
MSETLVPYNSEASLSLSYKSVGKVIEEKPFLGIINNVFPLSEIPFLGMAIHFEVPC